MGVQPEISVFSRYKYNLRGHSPLLLRVLITFYMRLSARAVSVEEYFESFVGRRALVTSRVDACTNVPVSSANASILSLRTSALQASFIYSTCIELQLELQ